MTATPSRAYRSWPGPARQLAVLVEVAVSAARSGDDAAFAGAITGLGAVDRDQLAVLLGSVTRELLEVSHPDGLDAESAEQVLQSAIRSAVGWYSGLDSDWLTRALMGALGIHDADESPATDGAAVLAHGVLLIADQLDASGPNLPTVLDRALRELLRAQTVELP